jgi:CheY-like chemotaxis protein
MPEMTTGRLLVVDDNKVNRLLLSRSLEQQGHLVEMAENGVQAIEMMQSKPFDLVLLDIEMPEMDGYKVLEKVTSNLQLRDIPIIITSALEELDSVVKCIEMGAEDYLTKPVNPVLLRARITASLEKKRLRDQQRELIKKFATSEVATDLETSGFALGGKFVEATAMFSDIRSFTTIAESQSTAETIVVIEHLLHFSV